jgi:membrane-associated phospholipid phosphatase
MRRSTFVLSLFVGSLISFPAFAEEPSAPALTLPAPVEAPPVRPQLRYSLPIDLTITGVGGTAWIVSEIFKSKITSPGCFWCNPPALDTSVKNALRWEDRQSADLLSYISGFGLAPFGAFGINAVFVLANGGKWKEVGIDSLVILESITIAADISQIAKFSVLRERPFVHDLSATAKLSTPSPSDNDLSFFSGHTTLAFVAAVSGGTVASLKGYKGAAWIWGAGITFATATGYLRIAADKHYFVDVLTGALVGSAVGFWVPWLHRPEIQNTAKKTAQDTPRKWEGIRMLSPLATTVPGGGIVGVQGVLE